MAPYPPPLWAGAKLPDRYQGMSCQELIQEYQRTRDGRIVVHLIRSNDGSKRRLTAILYNILKSGSRVEDFFQSLFLFLEQKLLEVGPIKNCAAWFSRVVRNQALNEWKRERRRPEIEANNLYKPKDPSNTEDHLARRMDARAMLERLEGEVSNIQEGWKCICLKWSGKSYTECAQTLGITFTQFRGRYQRAHRALVEAYGEDYEKYLDWAKMDVS